MVSKNLWRSAEELLAVLPSLNRVMAVKLREEIDEEITLAQFRVLTQLQERSITISELAEQRHVTRQATSLQVQGLVERGWVRRLPDPNDRRQAMLELTDEGLAQWQRARQSLTEYMAELLEALTAEELSALQLVIPAFQRVGEQARLNKRVPIDVSE